MNSYLCVYLTSFLSFFLLYFLLSLCFLFYVFTSLLVYFVAYLSTPRIEPFHFQAGGHRRRPNLALVFGFILCCSIFCYGSVFAFIVFLSICQY